MHLIESLKFHSAFRRKKGRVVVLRRFAHGVQIGRPGVRSFETSRRFSLPWSCTPQKIVSEIELDLFTRVVVTVGEQRRKLRGPGSQTGVEGVNDDEVIVGSVHGG